MTAAALTIAGSDPSGGAGIQADLKTFHQFGVYGEAVITLLTVQNTQTVSRVETVPHDFVAEQIEAVLSDIPPAAVKTGALGSTEIIEAIAAFAPGMGCPLVVDPVMISKHSARLISRDAEIVVKRRLLPCATVLTPNIPEAEILTGMQIHREEDILEAARRLLDYGCKSVLIKGGHSANAPNDYLVSGDGLRTYSGRRVETPHTHGTGCAFSAAITACLALGEDLENAIARAKCFIQAAIETAPGLGSGHGPINHFARCDDGRKN